MVNLLWKNASPKSQSIPFEKNYKRPQTLRKKSPPKSVNSSTYRLSQKPFAVYSTKPRKTEIQRSFVIIGFLGYSAHRMASALNQARLWKHFNVSFCRSLAGIQLFKDGGYCRLLLDPTGQSPIEVEDHKLAWRKQRPPPQPGPLAQPSQSWQTKPDAVINTETIPT